MIIAQLHGPGRIDDKYQSFSSTPVVGDTVHINGIGYSIIRRSWSEGTNRMSMILHLTLEQV